MNDSLIPLKSLLFNSAITSTKCCSICVLLLKAVHSVWVSRVNWQRLFGARQRIWKAKLNDFIFRSISIFRHGNEARCSNFEGTSADFSVSFYATTHSRKFSMKSCLAARHVFKFTQFFNFTLTSFLPSIVFIARLIEKSWQRFRHAQQAFDDFLVWEFPMVHASCIEKIKLQSHWWKLIHDMRW